MSQYICLAILIGDLTPDSCTKKRPILLAIVIRLKCNPSVIPANEPVIGHVCVYVCD